MTHPALRLENVVKRFGALVVTNDVSMEFHTGRTHALIGPNGAGKTTLFNLITGRLGVSSGRIFLGDEEVTGKREDRRARMGVGRTFQHSSLFESFPVLENVVLALRRRHGLAGSVIPSRKRERELSHEAYELLHRVGLGHRWRDAVKDLSHGERRQLEVAMALALSPKILLFDEPTAGMSKRESESFTDLIRALPDDLSVVLIEHDLDVVFSVADHVTVLAAGKVIAVGEPEQVQRDEAVLEAYLGTGLGEVFL
ncbi:ABC transporter ATP-binding protein [Enemella sp. A6]|uniref:ABC transporter ATP-binding protein n=1 Tax=Enemella sp. A6 TaxID=3440152 RepID=UPI003EBC7975